MVSKQRTNTEAKQSIVLPMIVGAALLVTLLYVMPVSRHLLEVADRVLLDKYHAIGRTTPARKDVVLLGIDDASITLSDAWPEDFDASPGLKAMKEHYPFPRRVWAMLIDKLCDAGVKAVFFDLGFRDKTTPEDDKALHDALQRHRDRVVIGSKFDVTQIGLGDPSSTLTLPHPALTDSEQADQKGTGVLNFWSDDDQVIRHVWFRILRSDADRAINPKERVAVDVTEKPKPSVSLALAQIVDPAVAALAPAQARLRFCAEDSFPPRSLHEVFVPALWDSNFQSGAFFKDKIVLVGSVLPIEHDVMRIPSGEIFGVQLHGHALSALLQNSFLRDAPEWVTWLGIAVALLLAWLAVNYIKQPIFCLFSIWMVSFMVFAASFMAFNVQGIEVSPLPFLLCFNVCGVSGITGRFLVQLRETRRLQRFLARYTSPELMREMLADRQGLYTTLSGVGRTVTVLFSDVRGFTSMSENMTPAEVVRQLNEYLSRMVERVFKFRGIVDKFIGDAVMALWGGTRSQQDEEGFKQDAINAVSSALEMRQALEELNKDWVARGMNELKIGIGIHQGQVVVGNIGSEAPHEKMDFTVIGDSVNLASRLEGVTKEYGVDLIISDVVHAHAKGEFLCRMADLVAVKGKSLPVEVFAVIGPKTAPVPAGLTEFEQAVMFYRQGKFKDALELFHLAKDKGLNDMLTEVYIERCEHLIEVPPEKWDGVYKMTKK